MMTQKFDIDLHKLQNIKIGTMLDEKENIVFVKRIPTEFKGLLH